MDKYRSGFEQRVKPNMDHATGEYKVEPFKDAQKALVDAMFATREREEFFGNAYSQILADLFVEWLKTAPHCVKEREYLYHVAMALGSVKHKLIGIETYGNNMRYMQSNKAQEEPEETND